VRALFLDRSGPVDDRAAPLRLGEAAEPHPARGEVRLRIRVCGVCHTELDEIEGRTPPSQFPRIPGHQVVGDVDEIGDEVDRSWLGARIGIAWIFSACGGCEWCRSGRENLCPAFVATGRDVDGGFAEYMVAPAAFVHRVPREIPDVQAAPLLCAGAIGLRSLELTGLVDGEALGLTGFGASGHLVITMARLRYPRSRVFVFARSESERALARERGAVWAGHTDDPSPEPLAAIIDTTPVWTPVVRALDQLAPGGRLVINAIRKEDGDRSVLGQIEYARHLWREKSIRSVANVTRADVQGCLSLAARYGFRPEVTTYPLEQGNEVLRALKRGGGRGAKVLVIGHSGNDATPTSV
jgi:propanol-preferring alcohol dehydrogenase